MDISKYSEKKEKGLLQIIAIGNASALVSKRFDPNTGDEIDSEMMALNREELVKQRDQLREQAQSFEALIDDIDNIKSQNNANSSQVQSVV